MINTWERPYILRNLERFTSGEYKKKGHRTLSAQFALFCCAVALINYIQLTHTEQRTKQIENTNSHCIFAPFFSMLLLFFFFVRLLIVVESN